MRIGYAVGLLALGLGVPALGDGPVITDVTARLDGQSWRFDVTVRHGDTGWDHYADGWSVQLEDGTEVGFRKLLHPHVNEQPFTRSLSGVVLPDGTEAVVLRAHDSVHGWGEPVRVSLD